jgi:hypothetical protein
MDRSRQLSPDGLGTPQSGSLSPSIRPMGGGSLGVQPPAEPPPPKIQSFEQKLGIRKSGGETWKRTPTATGHGASHVKTFHSKLSEDAFGFLDTQVNEWLDAHPTYEVKLVTTSIGEFQGKVGKEPHLIMQVWV